MKENAGLKMIFNLAFISFSNSLRISILAGLYKNHLPLFQPAENY
jgi:hypothetical protein